MADPVLAVALPAWLTYTLGNLTGMNADVSDLVAEWAAGSLDPVSELRDGSHDLLQSPGWGTTARASVSGAALRLLRDAATDSAVVAAVAESKDYPQLVQDGKLSPRALPLLLGLASATAVSANVGRTARHVRAAMRKGAEAEKRRSERQRSAASADASERPRLSPLPLDLAS
jgi:hypothetical protein